MRRRHEPQIKKRHKLSEHFSRKDFHCKSGLDDGSFRISAGLVGALELLRSLSGQRVNIIKGFECLDAAEKKGKVKRNYHTQGLAANITIDNTSLEKVFTLAEEIPEITGIGLNLDDKVINIRTNKGKERELWIITGGEEKEMDDKAREKYITTPTPKPK